jgi:hypothetical protein
MKEMKVEVKEEIKVMGKNNQGAEREIERLREGFKN